ncbi:acyltransferase family protein [Roseateles sp. BYS87W]|uniref:Acyltransferase family protein n=1 Tax=Pelomonas baiyunensis TaxID=3299026 RepID=A0ABW7GXB8_9BURK
MSAAPEARLPGLDLLRSLAIVWVMLFHTFLIGGLGAPWDAITRFGWAGVDLFFVLSGFLIGSQWLGALQRREPVRLRDFYLRRAWRILPAYLVVVAVYASAPALREAPGLAPLWQFLTFTLNLCIDYAQNQAFSHAWSLCVEEHFYLLFPVLALALNRRATARGVALAGAAVVLGGIALRTALWWHGNATQSDRPWFIEDLYYPTWTRLDGLLAGVGLAALRVARPALWQRLQAQPGRWAVAGGLLLAAAFSLFDHRTGLPANAVGWPLLSAGLACLVLAAASPRLPAVPGMAWLAGLSYSLYLSHKLALHAVHTWVAPALGWQGLAMVPVYALAIAALGAALHYGVERPGLLLRDRVRRPLRVAA